MPLFGADQPLRLSTPELRRRFNLAFAERLGPRGFRLRRGELEKRLNADVELRVGVLFTRYSDGIDADPRIRMDHAGLHRLIEAALEQKIPIPVCQGNVGNLSPERSHRSWGLPIEEREQRVEPRIARIAELVAEVCVPDFEARSSLRGFRELVLERDLGGIHPYVVAAAHAAFGEFEQAQSECDRWAGLFPTSDEKTASLRRFAARLVELAPNWPALRD